MPTEPTELDLTAGMALRHVAAAIARTIPTDHVGENT